MPSINLWNTGFIPAVCHFYGIILSLFALRTVLMSSWLNKNESAIGRVLPYISGPFSSQTVHFIPINDRPGYQDAFSYHGEWLKVFLSSHKPSVPTVQCKTVLLAPSSRRKVLCFYTNTSFSKWSEVQRSRKARCRFCMGFHCTFYQQLECPKTSWQIQELT